LESIEPQELEEIKDEDESVFNKMMKKFADDLKDTMAKIKSSNKSKEEKEKLLEELSADF
jgi:hypothetical protein